MVLRYFLNSNVYLTLLLALTAVIGDFVVIHSKLHIFRAIFDNSTHAIIGGISWLIFCMNHRNASAGQSIKEIALCSAVSSLIDLDHFFSARSFYLRDATSLKNRPPLHCSTFPVVLCGVLLILSYHCQIEWLKKLSLVILTAFSTHHIRDATRRGLWFCPFGSTAAIPYLGYVGITCLLPYFVMFLYRVTKFNSSISSSDIVAVI